MYDPVTRKWGATAGMTTQRSRVGVAVVDDVLYAIGGYDGRERLDTVEAFYPDLKLWKTVISNFKKFICPYGQNQNAASPNISAELSYLRYCFVLL